MGSGATFTPLVLGKPLTQVQLAEVAWKRASKEFAQQDWDPWVAARVGEASNPGPNPGSSSEDGLAWALLEVLKNYRLHVQAKPALPSAPTKLALKAQAPGQGSLAQVLHSVLEAAVSNAWEDSTGG